MKVTIAILCPENVNGDTAMCLAAMTPKIKGKYFLLSVKTAIVADGRNRALMEAKQNGSDYLMFIDSDIVFPEESLERMASLEKDIVTGIYHQGGQQNFRPCIYRFTEKGQIENLVIYPKDKPFRVDAAGAGMLLISRKVIDAVPDNAFDHINLPDVGQIYEDVSFFHRVREFGFEVWADPSLRIGHIKMQTIYPEHFDTVLNSMRHSVDKCESGINGWMTGKELDWLAAQAKGMQNIVEIGSHKGRSAKVLLENCPGLVTCVDLWDGNIEIGNEKRQQLWDGNEILNEFLSHCGSYPNMAYMREDSSRAAGLFPDKSVDMVFIDAGHSYEDCKRDIEAWLPKTRKLICGHDYSENWPGVMKAVDELLGNFYVNESIWYKEVK